MALAAIIQFCTNDLRFLQRNIFEVRKFAQRIVVTVCDHFYNGEPENRVLLEQIYRDFPDCIFVEFPYDAEKLYSPFHSHYSATDREWSMFWHTTSRIVGALYAPPKCDHLLFLDSDEIVDGERMKRWIAKRDYRAFSAIRFRSYYYSDPDRRAREIFDSALWVKRRDFDCSSMFVSSDRAGLYERMPDPKQRNQLDALGEPFIHHYCWVRTKEECLKKSRTWGHRLDKDWERPIEELFQGNQLSEPMDLPLSLYRTDPFFNPLQVEAKTSATCGSAADNVLRVKKREVYEKMLSNCFT